MSDPNGEPSVVHHGALSATTDLTEDATGTGDLLGRSPHIEPEHGAIPSDDTVEELKQLLKADESRLGEVYRLWIKGKEPEEISEELGVATYGFVYSYMSMVRALLEGEIAAGSTVARQNARKLRAILRRQDLSLETRGSLEENLKLLEAKASNESAINQEIAKAKDGSRDLEERLDSEHVAGIYVYSFPTYILHPRIETTNQIFYKVGHSEDDVGKRVSRQARTAMPENPIVLRVYEPTSDVLPIPKIEERFHRLLKAALHGSDEGGKEWFLTTLEFLDEIASALGLTISANEGISDLN